VLPLAFNCACSAAGGVCSFDCIVIEAVYWPTLDHHRIVAALHAAQTTNCSCYRDVTMSDAGDTITCDLCGKVWDMTNPIHKVAYDWHQLPALHRAAPKLFQAMAEAIDKLIEWQNKQGAYVVDTELTALTQQINVELVVQMGSFGRFVDGFHIIMQDGAVRSGQLLYPQENVPQEGHHRLADR
jgi:hypothetical protein